MPGRATSALPIVPRTRAFRETSAMIAAPLQTLKRHTDELGENFHYHFGGVRKVLVTSDPAVLRHVLKDHQENYRKSVIQTEHMADFLGSGLLTSHGDYWRRQRMLINQGFRPNALAALSVVMHASIRDSLPRFDAAARSGPVDLCVELMNVTFAMAARSLFGTSMSQDEIASISAAIARIQAFMVRRIVQPYLRPWFVVSGQWREHQALRADGDAILMRHIRARRTSQERHGDLLQVLMDTVYEDSGRGMTDEQLLSECMQLLVAAHETSSNALAWTIYLLCRHPAFMERARSEFETVLAGGTLSMAALPRLSVNTAILDESLRLYPPFWMVDRMAIAADRAGDVPIEAGTTIIAFLYGVHHAPRHWPDPERFDPDRYGGDGPKPNRDFTYLPFGAGPRGCIGTNYAMLQMLMVLSELLRRYDFALTSPEPIRMQPMIILRPLGGVPVHVRARTP
jgi:cytochrome P450